MTLSPLPQLLKMNQNKRIPKCFKESICRESFEIFEIINELKHLLPRILSGVESIAVIVFSIMLILEPGEHHAMIHVYLLLVELVFSPLIPLMDELWPHKKETSEEKTAE